MAQIGHATCMQISLSFNLTMRYGPTKLILPNRGCLLIHFAVRCCLSIVSLSTFFQPIDLPIIKIFQRYILQTHLLSIVVNHSPWLSRVIAIMDIFVFKFLLLQVVICTPQVHYLIHGHRKGYKSEGISLCILFQQFCNCYPHKLSLCMRVGTTEQIISSTITLN